MLRYDYLRYVAILIPCELCNNLYSITNTHDTHNVNYVTMNPSYNPVLAHQIQYNIISDDVSCDDVEAMTLQRTLNNNPCDWYRYRKDCKDPCFARLFPQTVTS